MFTSNYHRLLDRDAEQDRRIRGQFISPLNVGVGPFPAVATLEKWVEIVEFCIGDIGLRATLGLMREGLLRTVPGHVAFVNASDWVATSVTTIEGNGIEPFLTALVTRLRVVLADLPPGFRGRV